MGAVAGDAIVTVSAGVGADPKLANTSVGAVGAMTVEVILL